MGLSLGKPYISFHVQISISDKTGLASNFSVVSYEIPLVAKIDGKSKQIKTLTIESYTINEKQKKQFGGSYKDAEAWAKSQSHLQNMINEAKSKMDFWTDNYDSTVTVSYL